MNTEVKWLRVVPILFLAIFLTSQSARAHDVYKSIDNPEAKAFGNRVCTNKDCVKLAAMLIHDRNDKISPCDDFGAHVCGKFKINNDDPSYHYEAAFNIHRKLQKMLEAHPEPNEKPWYNLARSFYKKCIDTTSYVFPDLRVLLDEIGGWPALTAGTNDWTEFGESFEEYIASVHRKHRLSFFFNTTVQNIKVNENTKNNVIVITPSVTKLSYWSILELFPYCLHFNPKLDCDLFFKELYNAVEFSFANSGLYYDSKISHPINGTLAVIKKQFPNFNFEKYFIRLFDGVAPVDPETTVVVELPDYINQIHKLFRPENKRNITNYAGILIIKKLFKLREVGSEILTLENTCIYLMYSDFLVYPVSQMYLGKHFDHDAVNKITEMVKLIKEELRETLKNASWLDDNTRANALFKVDKMADSVGYPENLFNDTYVEENWSIPPSPLSESFYQLVARIERKIIASSLLKVTQPRDTISWDLPILMVNAYYYPVENKMVIQSGYIQLPFYSSKLPDYINYAVMGATIGHEIMHGFDNEGRFYDAFGKDVDWWDNATSDKYMEKANCYVKQYTEEGIDGRLSLGENIADNVGFKLAYGAYKRHLKKLGVSSEPALPAFEKFSLEQMFFIASSHKYCNNGKIEQTDPNDPHPPLDIRLKMIARNSKHFGKEFNCKKTSPMNPEEKCSLW